VDRLARAGAGLGCLTLLGHAFSLGAQALDLLRLPMEAGGLFLGPFVGLPLLVLALYLAAAGIALPLGTARVQAATAVMLTATADVFALLSGFRSPWLATAALVSGAAAVLLLATLVPRGAR